MRPRIPIEVDAFVQELGRFMQNLLDQTCPGIEARLRRPSVGQAADSVLVALAAVVPVPDWREIKDSNAALGMANVARRFGWVRTPGGDLFYSVAFDVVPLPPPRAALPAGAPSGRARSARRGRKVEAEVPSHGLEMKEWQGDWDLER